MELSVIGFGTWAIGADMWGPVDDQESEAAIQRALDLGITFFDTADFYGKGHSERILGKALGARRSEAFISTKGGLDWGQFAGRVPASDRPHYGMGGRKIEGAWRNSSPEYLRAAVDASLQRLDTDVIDLYFVHWPDPGVPIEETAQALDELRQAGKIRYLGVSNFSVEQMEQWLKVAPLHAVQPGYHMFWRDAERDVLPFCRERGIAVTTYGPLAHGLLSGKFTPETTFPPGDFRPGHPLFKGEAFLRNLEIVERLKAVAQRHGRTVGQLAIAWVLSQPGITSAIVGAKRPEQVVENARAAEVRLGKDELEEIEEILAGHDSGMP